MNYIKLLITFGPRISTWRKHLKIKHTNFWKSQFVQRLYHLNSNCFLKMEIVQRPNIILANQGRSPIWWNFRIQSGKLATSLEKCMQSNKQTYRNSLQLYEIRQMINAKMNLNYFINITNFKILWIEIYKFLHLLNTVVWIHNWENSFHKLVSLLKISCFLGFFKWPALKRHLP